MRPVTKLVLGSVILAQLIPACAEANSDTNTGAGAVSTATDGTASSASMPITPNSSSAPNSTMTMAGASQTATQSTTQPSMTQPNTTLPSVTMPNGTAEPTAAASSPAASNTAETPEASASESVSPIASEAPTASAETSNTAPAGSGGAGAEPEGPGGMGNAMGGAGGTPGMLPTMFTCNLVLGIDSTSEWFGAGFEDQVDNASWQLTYYHPGFIENWAKADDMVWSLTPTSPCAQNSGNPDRVIFNLFADPSGTYKDKAAYVTGIEQAITNLVAKYSNLVRIDLLTMTRAPDNMPCDPSNRMSIVEPYVDEAVAEVVASHPDLVTASPVFYAPDCNVYTDGGPHFTDTGRVTVADMYGDYYASH